MNLTTEMKKPLRAKKTMALSNRKQLGLLKDPQKAHCDASSRESLIHLKAAEMDYSSQKEPSCTPGPGQKPPCPSREPVASLVVNSEISIYADHREVLRDLPYGLSVANTDDTQLLNAGGLQDILCHLYDKHPGSPSVHSESEPADRLLDHLLVSSVNRIPASDAGADPVGKLLVHFPLPVLQLEGNHSQVPKKDDVPVVLSGDVQRKRATSGSDSDAQSKRLKTSGETAEGGSPPEDKSQRGLGKIKCFIQNQLDISMGKLDHRLQHLTERLDHTQCLHKQEEIAVQITKKISRLDKRISAMISFQKTEPSQKVNHLGADSQYKILNCTTLLPGTADGKLAPSDKPVAIPSKTLPSTVERSRDPGEVLCLDELEEDSGVLDTAAPGDPPKAAAGSPELVAEKSSQSKLQNMMLIDLTDEGNLTDSEEKEPGARRRNSAQESLPQPAQRPTNPVPTPFSHLPPLPSSHCSPEQAQGLQGANTLPPQKLELAVAQVSQPKGIALQWNVSRVDPRCAPIESFSLFICLEDASSGVTSSWMKTNVIKALPLPMACSLSRFPSAAKCYFTMQSRDIHGRYGPFCEIQAISAL